MPWVRHESAARWRRACDSARLSTSPGRGGGSIFKMMEQSRHRSVETLRGYVRDAEIFKKHAGAGW
jgi:hypothetical protein